MASLIDKIRHYMSTPGGRKNVEKAKTMANDPRNQQKLRQLMDRFRGGRTQH